MASNNANIKESVLHSIAVERKKIVFACLLIAVMVFMWSRALGKKKPAMISAEQISDSVLVQSKEPVISVEYFPVSVVMGHEEFSGKDFFDISKITDDNTVRIESSEVVSAGTMGSVNDNSGNRSGEEKLEEVVRKLSLRAVVSGSKPMALINDSIYRSGDLLSVGIGQASYNLRIMDINQNRVKLECMGREVQLTLTQGRDGIN